jgi:DNA-binding NarL/FixJ family response regulator
MGLRVLIIDDEPVYRRLLAHHVAAVAETPAIEEYDPASAGRLPQGFPASNYDVVLLDDKPGAGSGLEWLEDLRNRPGFPPVVYLMSETSTEVEAAAGAAGAIACLFKRKINPKRLAGALRAAEAEAQTRREAPQSPAPSEQAPAEVQESAPVPAHEAVPAAVPGFLREPAPERVAADVPEPVAAATLGQPAPAVPGFLRQRGFEQVSVRVPESLAEASLDAAPAEVLESAPGPALDELPAEVAESVPGPALREVPAAAQPSPAPAVATGSEAADEACRFGNLVLRGFRYVRKLAQSPNSTVYLADDQRSGQRVVLKVLSHLAEAGAKSGDAFTRFLREYDIASSIEHPNIVKIHDFGAGDDYAYIAMEYFPEGDLRSRIRAGLTPLEAATLARQMAEALQALHAAGVLHRDLKPGNVMQRADGSIALIDFGMAKQLELEAGLTGNGEIFGTPYYMSPEQGHGRITDERSDLYSLGIILYEMLMRRKPYVAGTPMQVIYKHANAPLPELSAGLKRFEPILYNCIAKDPARRYPSAQALAAALRDAESDAADSEFMGL